jgi:signal transduction histidine kinase
VREVATILDHLPIGVAVFDAAARLTIVNRRLREILGADETEVRARIQEIRTLDGRTLEADEHPVARALRGELVPAQRFVLPGGAQVVEIAARALESGVAVTVDDATSAHALEQSERNFVANAAHQIWTPITVIAGIVGALEQNAELDPQTLRSFLRHIDAAVGRLTGLVDGLLTLARVQRGQTAAVEEVPMARVFQRVAAVSPTPLEVHPSPDVVAFVHEGLLVEALSNITDNAVIHGAGPVELSARTAGDRVVVEVRDHGDGILPEGRDAALRRFAGTGSGAGLGLAVAADAIAAMDGRLDLLDADGGGLLVRITLACRCGS